MLESIDQTLAKGNGHANGHMLRLLLLGEREREKKQIHNVRFNEWKLNVWFVCVRVRLFVVVMNGIEKDKKLNKLLSNNMSKQTSKQASKIKRMFRNFNPSVVFGSKGKM